MSAPTKGQQIRVTSARWSGQRTAVVVGLNYFFERVDGAYVDYLDGDREVCQLVWLHQIAS